MLANRYTLSDTERAGVLLHLIVEGDLSGYGLVDVVTGYAQDVEDYDRATEFEALGGPTMAEGVAGQPGVYLISGVRWSLYGAVDLHIAVGIGMTVTFLFICLGALWWVFNTGYRLRR